MVEHLYILETGFSQLRWQDDIEINQWLELLHPFTTAKDLYISSKFTPRIASALKEVLPSLQNLFLEDSAPSGNVQETIGQFVAAQQLAGHPIAVSNWERKSLEDLYVLFLLYRHSSSLVVRLLIYRPDIPVALFSDAFVEQWQVVMDLDWIM